MLLLFHKDDHAYMPILPRRFKRLQDVLNSRMGDLTVLLEKVDKPHNLSAIIRTCDAIGIVEAHTICSSKKGLTFNSTAQGSQKWVGLTNHTSISDAIKELKNRGFKLFGTTLQSNSSNYLDCDFTGPTAFVLGAEKWGLSNEAKNAMDSNIYIPMQGMVQSLNVSVAAATLLFEALRQRKVAGLVPKSGEGISPHLYRKLIFEWAYPEVAIWCQNEGREYPNLSPEGEILEDLPRSLKLKC